MEKKDKRKEEEEERRRALTYAGNDALHVNCT